MTYLANKFFIALVALTVVVLSTYVANRDPEAIAQAVEQGVDLDEAYAEELGLYDEFWLTSWTEAVAQSTELNRPIFLLFTGTQWCPPCQALERTALQTAQFNEYAMDHLVLLKYDFPSSGNVPTEYQQKANQYRVQGFPTYLIVNPDGRVLKKAVGAPRGGLQEVLQFCQSAR
ncbi:MAG: thioredoxin family protein [Opitutales bacterium]